MKRKKAEKLFHLLGEIDAEIIREVEDVSIKKAQPILFKRRKNVLRLATLVASVVFLVISIWGMSQFGMQSDEADLNFTMEAGEVAMADEAELEEDALDSNIFTDDLVLFDCLGGNFWHELTLAQIEALLPSFIESFDATVSRATASYLKDGTLVEVSIDLEVSTHHPNVDTEMLEIRMARENVGICNDIIFTEAPSHLIQGVEVTVAGDRHSFVLDGVIYQLERWVTDEMLEQIILNGPANLEVLANPEIPEMWSESRTLEEAVRDPDFGKFVPADGPEPFQFRGGSRTVWQHQNDLFLEWSAYWDEDDLMDIYQNWLTTRSSTVPPFSFDDIFWLDYSMSWEIRLIHDDDRLHVVSIQEPENYDWSQHPLIEWDDDGLRFHEVYDNPYIHHPVFLAEELTFEAVVAREWQRIWTSQGAYADDPSDTTRDIFIPLEISEMNFGILFDDIIVNIHANGLTAEQVWEMIQSMEIME